MRLSSGSRRKRRGAIGLAFAAITGLVAVLGLIATTQAETGAKYEAQFNSDGGLIRPEGWREWVYIGTPLTPNSLNPPEAAFRSFTAFTSIRPVGIIIKRPDAFAKAP